MISLANRKTMVAQLVCFVATSAGCTVRNVDVGSFSRPDRPAELSAYDVFVGDWDWEAKTVVSEGQGQSWRGTAEWRWTLDRRALHGKMSAQGGELRFEVEGYWGWHPRSKRYFWRMINNWGYPQEGSAGYDRANEKWTMHFKSVGLDGTTSYGRHTMSVVDQNTLAWDVIEWADPLHLIQKVHMKGTYRRR